MVATTMATTICEYRLYCPECGDKSATWTVDNPTDEIVKDSFRTQYEGYTFPLHVGHGTLTIIEERVLEGVAI